MLREKNGKWYVPITKEQHVESRMGVPFDVLVEQTKIGRPGGLTVEDAGPVRSLGGGVDEIRSFEEIEAGSVTLVEVNVWQYVLLKKL